VRRGKGVETMLSILHQSSIQDQLHAIHLGLKSEMPRIDRVAVAIYDSRTDNLKTFVHSTNGDTPFIHREEKLSDVPSLAMLARAGDDRVVQDLKAPGRLAGQHDRQLLVSGYRSSYTRPFYDRGRLYGFLFFDSMERAYFTPTLVRHLSLYSNLISLMIVNALAPANELRSAAEVAREMSRMRDVETGAHLERMARYARLIANALAEQHSLEDEAVEFVFQFAPLHDVGKIGIPDTILLKPGPLTPDEFEIMKSHVSRGVHLVDTMANSFGIRSEPYIDVLRNIVEFHHEAVDGSGYPEGRRGSDIPLEARIVTVADVFDALTSTRPYKEAWPNDRALQFLGDRSGQLFDPECVDALIGQIAQVEQIQARFCLAKGAFEGFHEAYMEGL
jgi:HD-GYP domain-containing protein (c-di-GMP phosphodiesterase class II)